MAHKPLTARGFNALLDTIPADVSLVVRAKDWGNLVTVQLEASHPVFRRPLAKSLRKTFILSRHAVLGNGVEHAERRRTMYHGLLMKART